MASVKGGRKNGSSSSLLLFRGTMPGEIINWLGVKKCSGLSWILSQVAAKIVSLGQFFVGLCGGRL